MRRLCRLAWVLGCLSLCAAPARRPPPHAFGAELDELNVLLSGAERAGAAGAKAQGAKAAGSKARRGGGRAGAKARSGRGGATSALERAHAGARGGGPLLDAERAQKGTKATTKVDPTSDDPKGTSTDKGTDDEDPPQAEKDQAVITIKHDLKRLGKASMRTHSFAEYVSAWHDTYVLEENRWTKDDVPKCGDCFPNVVEESVLCPTRCYFPDDEVQEVIRSSLGGEKDAATGTYAAPVVYEKWKNRMAAVDKLVSNWLKNGGGDAKLHSLADWDTESKKTGHEVLPDLEQTMKDLRPPKPVFVIGFGPRGSGKSGANKRATILPFLARLDAVRDQKMKGKEGNLERESENEEEKECSKKNGKQDECCEAGCHFIGGTPLKRCMTDEEWKDNNEPDDTCPKKEEAEEGEEKKLVVEMSNDDASYPDGETTREEGAKVYDPLFSLDVSPENTVTMVVDKIFDNTRGEALGQRFDGYKAAIEKSAALRDHQTEANRRLYTTFRYIAGLVSSTLQEKAATLKRNLYYESSGDETKRILEKIKEMKSYGYRVVLVYSYRDTPRIIKERKEREKTKIGVDENIRLTDEQIKAEIETAMRNFGDIASNLEFTGGEGGTVDDYDQNDHVLLMDNRYEQGKERLVWYTTSVVADPMDTLQQWLVKLLDKPHGDNPFGVSAPKKTS